MKMIPKSIPQWICVFLFSVNFCQTKDLSFSEMKKSPLYFIILLDRNLDGIIDEGELKVVTVNFKR